MYYADKVFISHLLEEIFVICDRLSISVFDLSADLVNFLLSNPLLE